MTSTGEWVAFYGAAAAIVATGIWAVTARRTFHSVMALGGVLVSVAALFIILDQALLGVVQVLVYVGGVLTLFLFAVMFVAGDEQDDVAPEGNKRPVASAIQWTIGTVVGVAAFGIAWTQLPVVFTWVGAQVVWASWLELVVGLAAAGAGFGLLLVVAILAHIGLVALLGQRRRTLLATFVAGALFLVLAIALWQTEPWQTEGQGGEDIEALANALFDTYLIPFEALGVLLTAAMIGALVLARPLGAPLDADNYPRPTEAQMESTQQVSDLDWTPSAAPAAAAVTGLVPDTEEEE